MNQYDKKAQKMKQHLKDHPNDYQSVVSLFITESKSIEYEKRQRKIEMMKEIVKYK